VRDFSTDHSLLSINTATLRKEHGKEVSLAKIVDVCARHGIRALSPWRDQVQAIGLAEASRLIRASDMALSGYCRGGMFTASEGAGLAAARDDNRRAVDEACELNAACLVLVAGALPGALIGRAKHKDISLCRSQVFDGIEELLEYARARKMPLAIEPLHPMYAADRACINTLEHALEICDALDPATSGALGVAVDVYHVWWDPKLEAQIEKVGKKRLLAFHVSDWLTPTTDLLLDRGMMGDGVIDIRRIRGCVEAQGFDGFSEVEIFSEDKWWRMDHETVVKTCIERHKSAV
jgi:sugar phosphate isomerase/epimerase